jgi:hypothetical protein
LSQQGFGGGGGGGFGGTTTGGFGNTGGGGFGGTTGGGLGGTTGGFGNTGGGGFGGGGLGGTTGGFGGTTGGFGTNTGFGGTAIGNTGQYSLSGPVQSMFGGGGAQGQGNNFLNQFLQQQQTAGRAQQTNRQTQTTGQNVRPPVRVRMNIAFDPTPPPAAISSSAGAIPAIPGLNATHAGTRLSGLIARRGLADATIEMDGRTAVLRGTVSDANERSLLERIASMEPGVSDVRNELEVSE